MIVTLHFQSRWLPFLQIKDILFVLEKQMRLKRKDFWISMALVNLCLVPLFGAILRTKFLFTVPFINYKNVLSAHSHFAFGGWVTLMLMIFFIEHFLPSTEASKNKYQYVLWATQLSALGMAFTFPFTGYGLLAIIFSTLFIFATYAFSWIFTRDLLKVKIDKAVSLLAITSVACLVISSIGPFALAYILATKSGNAMLFRDALYTFLHFQYNGFFTLGVFALFFKQVTNSVTGKTKKGIYYFSLVLASSILPALFLSLTWHPGNQLIQILAVLGAILTFLALICFLLVMAKLERKNLYATRIAYIFWVFAMISFAIKMLLQTGTIFPDLANMVFGFRPIIIGFLHLVFLGFVTFYLLAHLIETGGFNWKKQITKWSMVIFAGGIILNETLLMIQGAGLMFGKTHNIFYWLLWVVGILLFAGSLLILMARIRSIQDPYETESN